MKFFQASLQNVILSGLLFATMPSSSSYQLNNYGFGSGGTGNSTSSSYKLNATTGELSNAQSTSTNYKARSGNNNVQQSGVPVAPTFTNPSSYYDKLRFIIIPGANPSDTKFSIAISSDNFVTTQYIKSDNTVGSVRGIGDYQTYAVWGGASGQLVVGLTPSTTYKIKVNAFQGNFTETEYGPTASAATVAPSVTFDIDTAAADIETAGPYSVSFATLFPGTVVGSTEKIWIDLNTNANSGAAVYISSLNGGLKSAKTNFTIASATADLSAASSGYGALGLTTTQTSGGPVAFASPYNGAGQNVGIINSTLRQIFSTALPVTAGRVSVQIKTKASNVTPSSNDYADTLTLTTAGIF